MQEFDQETKDKIAAKVEKLKSSKFKQLELPSWRPKNSVLGTMLVFGFFSFIFVGIGILLYIKSDDIFELTKRYDNNKECVENGIGE